MYKVIVDANVLVSAIFGGVPLNAVKLAYNHTVLYSDKSEAELKLLPQKLLTKLTVHQIISLNRCMKELLLKGTPIKVKSKIDVCRDVKDNHFLDLAYKGKADIIITGDKDLLSITREELNSINLFELQILTPKQFCSFIERGTSN